MVRGGVFAMRQPNSFADGALRLMSRLRMDVHGTGKANSGCKGHQTDSRHKQFDFARYH